MTISTAPPAVPPERSPKRPWLSSVVLPGVAGIVAIIGALILIVVIRPLGWRLLATGLLWVMGVAGLIVSSDGLDQVRGRSGRLADEALHCLSASFVALALVVVLGAVVPSLLSVSASPPLFAAVGCDVVIGLVAGFLTLLLAVLSGWAGGELSYRLRRTRWVDEGQPERFRLSLRDEWSLRDAMRIVVLAVAGVLASAGVTQLFVAAPSKTAALAADTAPRLPSVTSLVLPLVAWFLTAGLVWVAFDWAGRRPRRTGSQPETAHRHRPHHLRRATHASALAIGLAIMIGWLSASVLNNMIHDSLSTHGTVTGVSLRSVPPGQQVSYLAQKFVPRFELAQSERWEPTTVDWYVAHSQPTHSPAFCAGGQGTEPQGCRQLCDLRTGSKCAPPCDDPDPSTCAPRGGTPHAVYYLYLDPTNTPPGVDHPARSGHDWAVIEYWIFYNYDSLSAGLITQWHQSDWEQVSVLLERKGTTVYPVEVAFSEHCYGVAALATEVSWSGSHPVSFVALGSHGNYPTQTDVPIRQLQCLTRQTPRYLGAAGLFFNPWIAGWSLELPIAYLIGLRDQTGKARTIADVQPISQKATPSIWSFHGYWGVDNNLRVAAGGLPTGAGPESPQDQNPSRKPFQDMLCSPTWLKTSPTRATDWACRP